MATRWPRSNRCNRWPLIGCLTIIAFTIILSLVKSFSVGWVGWAVVESCHTDLSYRYITVLTTNDIHKIVGRMASVPAFELIDFTISPDRGPCSGKDSVFSLVACIAILAQVCCDGVICHKVGKS